MQDYFGEQDPEDCRICDNCLKKYALDEEKELEYKEKILSLIRQRETLPLQELVTSFSVLRKDKIIELLELLEGENLIHLDQQMVIHLQTQ